MGINLSEGREYIFRPADYTLYEEGQEVDYIFFLIDGVVDVFRSDELLTRLHSSIETDAEINNGSHKHDKRLIILNEFEALLGQETSVTVKTVSDCVFLVINSEGLVQAITGNPEIAIRFVRQLAHRADSMRREINKLRAEINRQRRLLFLNRKPDDVERVLEQTSPGTLLLEIGHFLKKLKGEENLPK